MKTALLKDVCEIITRGISPKYTIDTAVGVTVLNQKCIRNHSISLEPSRLHDISAKSVAEAKFVRSGDVLVNSTGHGTLGRTALAEDISGDILVDSHVTIIRPKPGLFESRYSAYLIGMHEDEFINMATGTSGQTELPRALLNNCEIYYDESIEEQRRIVAKLDAAFDKIDRAIGGMESIRSKYRLLFESALEESFRGLRAPSQTLDRVIEDKLIGLVRSKKEQYLDKGYPYLKMDSIANNNSYAPKLHTNVLVSISELEKYRLERNDFLFNTRNSKELVGKFCLYPGGESTVFNNNIMRLRFKNEVTPDYIYFAFLSQYVNSQIRSKVSGTTNVAAIYYKEFKDVTLPIPPKNDQLKIAEKLSRLQISIESAIQLNDRKQKYLISLKQSMLKEAFQESAVK